MNSDSVSAQQTGAFSENDIVRARTWPPGEMSVPGCCKSSDRGRPPVGRDAARRVAPQVGGQTKGASRPPWVSKIRTLNLRLSWT